MNYIHYKTKNLETVLNQLRYHIMRIQDFYSLDDALVQQNIVF